MVLCSSSLAYREWFRGGAWVPHAPNLGQGSEWIAGSFLKWAQGLWALWDSLVLRVVDVGSSIGSYWETSVYLFPYNEKSFLAPGRSYLGRRDRAAEAACFHTTLLDFPAPQVYLRCPAELSLACFDTLVKFQLFICCLGSFSWEWWMPGIASESSCWRHSKLYF